VSTSFGWEGKGRYGSFRCGCARGVQVKLWDPLRTRAIPGRFRGVNTTRRYTNPRLRLRYQGESEKRRPASRECGNLTAQPTCWQRENWSMHRSTDMNATSTCRVNVMHWKALVKSPDVWWLQHFSFSLQLPKIGGERRVFSGLPFGRPCAVRQSVNSYSAGVISSIIGGIEFNETWHEYSHHVSGQCWKGFQGQRS